MKTHLFAIATISATTLCAQPKNNSMKIVASQTAPAFIVKDLEGKTICLSDLKGKKVYLTFNRNVGCPICNLRYHELQQQSDYFISKGLVILSVYESSLANMKQYLEGESQYAAMISNPNKILYQLYEV